MAIVNRWYQILENLIQKQQLSINELKAKLGVSKKTLLTSIEQLNDVLEEQIEITDNDDLLSLNIYDYDTFEEVMSGSLRKDSDFNSSSKRVSFIIKSLIQSPDPLLIDDLAELVGVSRTTINKDIKKVRELANEYDISVSGKPNKGLVVEGNEFDLRLFYTKQVYSFFDSQILKEETIHFLKELYEQFHLPQNIRKLYDKVVAVTVGRIKRQRQLEEAIPYYRNVIQVNPFLDDLIYHVEVTYHISLSQYEVDFLSYPLNLQAIEGFEYHLESIPVLKQITEEMIQRATSNLDILLEQSFLQNDMRDHLYYLINRLIFKRQMQAIFEGDFQETYPLAYAVAQEASEVLSERFQTSVASPEVGYLALYFEVALRGYESLPKKNQESQ